MRDWVGCLEGIIARINKLQASLTDDTTTTKRTTLNIK